MKFKIVFYLFIFVCIILFFQLINSNKLLNYQDDLIQSQNRLNLILKDSIKNLNEYRNSNIYFSLNSNGEINLTENKKEERLKQLLREYNTNGNLIDLLPEIPKEHVFLIDHIKVVNSQWVLLGFKSDQQKGQALVSYQINSKKVIDFSEVIFYIE
ncbi:hypothetical protein N9I27_02850 [Flavobacteriaceae bacterium]|nr:hypothetical protein [Flavobacteriaceae bacterium]MDB4064102.1 hypothetical protein [Flavobacteriaceae bacterium]